MYNKFSKTVDANSSMAMETRDHSRLLSVAEINGANPKSLMSRRNLSIMLLVLTFFCFTTAFTTHGGSDDQSCKVTVYYKDGSLAKYVSVTTDVSGGISCMGGREFETNKEGIVTLKWAEGCYLKKVYVKGKGYTVDYKDGKSYTLTLNVNS